MGIQKKDVQYNSFNADVEHLSNFVIQPQKGKLTNIINTRKHGNKSHYAIKQKETLIFPVTLNLP